MKGFTNIDCAEQRMRDFLAISWAFDTNAATTRESASFAQSAVKLMLQKSDERNRNLIVNINGQLVHRDKAGISPFDSAVQGGDAVWEGLRLYNGRIFKLLEHLHRLGPPAAAGSSRCADSSREFAQFNSGQDRSEQRRGRRCADARHERIHRR